MCAAFVLMAGSNNNTSLLVPLSSTERLRTKPDCSDLQLYGHYCELGSSTGAKWPPLLPAHLAGGWDPPKLIQPRGSSCQQDY